MRRPRPRGRRPPALACPNRQGDDGETSARPSPESPRPTEGSEGIVGYLVDYVIFQFDLWAKVITSVVDYTTDLNAIVAGINGLSLNPPPSSNVAEGILDIGKAMVGAGVQAVGEVYGHVLEHHEERHDYAFEEYDDASGVLH